MKIEKCVNKSFSDYSKQTNGSHTKTLNSMDGNNSNNKMKLKLIELDEFNPKSKLWRINVQFAIIIKRNELPNN